MKAPTRSEISAISIKWKNVKPWLLSLPEAVALVLDDEAPETVLLFWSKVFESWSF
jgi:hypothetical protein